MTTNFRRIVVAAAGLAACNASADAIYRCQSGGHLSYSDQPCARPQPPAASASRALPPLGSMTPVSKGEQSLAKQFDDAATRAAVQQAGQNAESVREYQAKKARDEAIDQGYSKGYVVVGMTKHQVEHVLNLPSHVDSEGSSRERWIYLEGRHKRTITFDNGLVVSDSSHSKKSG